MALVLAVSFLGYQEERDKQVEPGNVTLKIITLGNTTQLSYNFGGTIKELLLIDHNVTGVYRLECLDGVCESSEYAWEIRVNEKLISKSIHQQIVGDKDLVLVTLK